MGSKPQKPAEPLPNANTEMHVLKFASSASKIEIFCTFATLWRQLLAELDLQGSYT